MYVPRLGIYIPKLGTKKLSGHRNFFLVRYSIHDGGLLKNCTPQSNGQLQVTLRKRFMTNVHIHLLNRLKHCILKEHPLDYYVYG